MFRRSSLPLVGLFNTSTRRVDAEFSLRVSVGSAKLAWYSGVTFVRIANPQSNAVRLGHRMALEETALKICYYLLAGRLPPPTLWRPALSSAVGPS
jgi:hypothetical protein